MKVPVYNKKGEEEKKIKLSEDIFGLDVNDDLVYQVVVSQQANRRQNTAHSKDRSEKRGGGRKPWRQKGTGRARHGSIRSPIWTGGGVTFGPRNERNYKKKINQKEQRKALFMVLSGKVKSEMIFLIDDLDIDRPKTKEMDFLEKLPCEGSILIAADEYDEDLLLACRNLPEVEVMQAKDLNSLDLLKYKNLVMPEESLKVIKNTFS